MRDASGIFAVLSLDTDHDEGGLAHALIARLRTAIEIGTVKPGDRLPSSRRLADGLGISRGTVSAAIETLIAEGVLETRVGSGTFVSGDASALLKPEGRTPSRFAVSFEMPDVPDVDEAQASNMDFRPCRPSLEAFPINVWKRCVAQAGSVRPLPDYGSPLGDEGLRAELCRYLHRARGLQIESEQMIITNGAVNAMHLAAALCVRPGTKVVVEDPGYPLARQVFASAGADLVPIAVDEEGLRVDLLPRAAEKIALVVVTPSHQFPTGSRLSLARRSALIAWAERNGVLVIEDDYDGEFRYDVPPLSPLAAMGNGCVLYVGTFSKTMFPGLRIGFAAGPKPLIDAMARLRAFAEYAPNDLNQRALLNFISARHYERHILRMRRIYSQKRKRFIEAATRDIKGARIAGIESGLNALLVLPEDCSAQSVSAALKAKSVHVPAVSRYSVSNGVSDSGLVVGYAAPTHEQIARLSELIANAIQVS